MLPPRQSAIISGQRQSWHEAGSGRPLVLIHGIGSDSQVWESQMVAFASRYRVIAWDMPGYGQAERLATDRPAALNYGAALAALLEHLSVTQANFVAHSLGGIVSLSCFSRWRGAPLSLSLLSPVAGAGRLPAEKREAIRQARIGDLERLGMKGFSQARGRAVLGSKASEAAALRHLSIMTQIDQRAYLQAWEMMCASDIFPLLANAPAASQVISGSDDTVAPEALCREIAAALPASDFVRLSGVGHSAAIEASEELNGHLARFLAAGDEAGRS